MMEEETTPHLRTGRDDETLLYDYFKHLSSLSLLTLGGVLTLSQSGDQDFEKSTLIVVLLFVATSGIASFMGADELVGARTRGAEIPRRVMILKKVAPATFALGIGAFLYNFVKVLG